MSTTEELTDLEQWIERAASLGIAKATLRSVREIRAVGHGDGVTVGPVTWVQLVGYQDGVVLRTTRLELEPSEALARLAEAGLDIRHTADHIY